PHRPVMDEKPAIPTVLPPHSTFQLKRRPICEPHSALVPHPPHIIRMMCRRVSYLELRQTETNVFKHGFISVEHTAIRREGDDRLRYGIGHLAKFSLI